MQKTFEHTGRPGEYTRLFQGIKQEMGQGNYAKALDDLLFLGLKAPDDVAGAAFDAVGLNRIYPGRTDEELRERINRNRGLAAFNLWVDLLDFAPEVKKPIDDRLREALNIRLFGYDIGAKALPAHISPLDGLAFMATTTLKGTLYYMFEDLFRGRFGDFAVEAVRMFGPHVGEHYIGDKYSGFWPANTWHWLGCDITQSEREGAYGYRPRYYAPRGGTPTLLVPQRNLEIEVAEELLTMDLKRASDYFSRN